MSWTSGKYVVGEVKSPDGFDLAAAILIPEYIQHVSLAPCFSEIYGAGFFNVDHNGKISVYGKSVSLNTNSRPQDVKMIAKVLLLEEENS